ncbi:MAG: peptide ABC transporter permease [Candidatus Goldiibacteriota bacterium HGW-Goldbacteria-1]|jgi:peptide/nickel transport system permease protein|nr:MAG: peptide ABC transporter permease [Candidatus Goldiibacteriota bacterium HGW-Goldbacteria-1]
MNKMMTAGLIVVVFIVAMAILAPVISPRDYREQDISQRLQSPSKAHIMGTDELGRDVFSRLLRGTRVSVSVGIMAVLISAVIGVLLGIIAGYFGGVIDNIIMRGVDIFLTVPTLFLILMLIVFLGPSIFNIVIIIGLTSWTDIARIVRAEVLYIKKLPYVEAAKLLGFKKRRIMFRHILPNAFSPVLVYITFGISGAILAESGLSFLGLGVQPPEPSWGNILTSGKDYIDTAWWLVLYPGLSIFAAVFSFNLLGEGLRDYLNPKLDREG